MSAMGTLLRFAERTGWNDNSMLHVACDYIDNQSSDDAFEDFVSQQAEAETTPARPTTRQIEMAVLRPDQTWNDCIYVDIPINTPEGEIWRVASEKLLAEFSEEGTEVVSVHVYRIPNEFYDEHDNLWEFDSQGNVRFVDSP